jgi:hypothetical protein
MTTAGTMPMTEAAMIESAARIGVGARNRDGTRSRGVVWVD